MCLQLPSPPHLSAFSPGKYRNRVVDRSILDARETRRRRFVQLHGQDAEERWSRRKKLPTNNGHEFHLSQLVPDAPAGAVLTQVALLHQGPEMLFERVAIAARQSNRIAHGDTPMFACEFDDL